MTAPAPADEDWPFVWAMRQVSHQQRTEERKKVSLPVDVLPHLALGDALSVKDVARLRSLGVTHVLNAAGKSAEGPVDEFERQGLVYKTLFGEDNGQYEMLDKHLAASRAFIDDAKRKGGRVVVHCVRGLNRSGVLVAAEVMLARRVDVLSAVHYVRSRRGRECLSNRNFHRQIVALARRETLLGPRPSVVVRHHSSPRKSATTRSAARVTTSPTRSTTSPTRSTTPRADDIDGQKATHTQQQQAKSPASLKPRRLSLMPSFTAIFRSSFTPRPQREPPVPTPRS